MLRIGLLYFGFICIFNLGFSQKANTYFINLFVGDVRVSPNSGIKWILAEAEMELKEADSVKTGSDSYCDILMQGRGSFRVYEETVIAITKLRKQLEEITVKKGKALFTVNTKLKEGETFKVETDVAIAAVRGTEFTVNSDTDKVNVSVGKGTVVVKRNINLPQDLVNDQEIQQYISFDVGDNQQLDSIDLTADENKELEDMITRVKKNRSELISGLKKSKEETMKRNIDRVLKELEGSEESGDADSLIQKMKQKTK